MKTRTIWRGTLTVGSFAVAVRIVGVDDSSSKVSFNHAHRCTPKTLTRIQQKKWCPTCKRQLLPRDILRVYECAPGRYLEITDAELATCDAEASSMLVIAGVLDAPLDAIYIAETALLVPDGDTAAEAFEIVRSALRTPDRRALTAVATLVLQKRRQHVMIGALDHGCAVYFLRTVDQVRALHASLLLEATPTRARVQELRALLEALASPFPYETLRDTHGEQVRALVAKRVTAAQRPKVKR